MDDKLIKEFNILASKICNCVERIEKKLDNLTAQFNKPRRSKNTISVFVASQKVDSYSVASLYTMYVPGKSDPIIQSMVFGNKKNKKTSLVAAELMAVSLAADDAAFLSHQAFPVIVYSNQKKLTEALHWGKSLELDQEAREKFSLTQEKLKALPAYTVEHSSLDHPDMSEAKTTLEERVGEQGKSC